MTNLICAVRPTNYMTTPMGALRGGIPIHTTESVKLADDNVVIRAVISRFKVFYVGRYIVH